MKKLILLLVTIISVLSVNSQSITGDWYGIIKVQKMEIRIVLHINDTDSGYNGTMDSPDQNVTGLIMSTIGIENDIFKFNVDEHKIEYEGSLSNNNAITGTFKQRGQSVALDFSRERPVSNIAEKSQTPIKPYPYYSEDVLFENKKDNITLAGTLTLPKQEGNYPAVILISGSGPQNRDEEIAGHKPFLVLADHLTKNGIAVLRYDDRGTAESKGKFNTATSADFATDVEAALQYLKSRKEINSKKIGLIGHSEGGMIAPMIASASKDVYFMVLLAAPGLPIDEMMLLQNDMIGRASGIPEEGLKEIIATNQGAYDIIKSTKPDSLKNTLTTYYYNLLKNGLEEGASPSEADNDFIRTQIMQLTSPWMQYFIKFTPEKYLQKVKCPVLALNGSMDKQVASSLNLKSIKQALDKGGNKNVTIKELAYLNHLFQECETGAPSEYAQIEQTFSPIALTEITNWLLKQVK